MRCIFPLFYTEKECGEWKVWLYGPIDIDDLRTSETGQCEVYSKESDSVPIVHALAFEQPAAGHNVFPRWDAINGWTTTIEESKAKWPHGKQGQIDARKYFDSV